MCTMVNLEPISRKNLGQAQKFLEKTTASLSLSFPTTSYISSTSFLVFKQTNLPTCASAIPCWVSNRRRRDRSGASNGYRPRSKTRQVEKPKTTRAQKIKALKSQLVEKNLGSLERKSTKTCKNPGFARVLLNLLKHVKATYNSDAKNSSLLPHRRLVQLRPQACEEKEKRSGSRNTQQTSVG